MNTGKEESEIFFENKKAILLLIIILVVSLAYTHKRMLDTENGCRVPVLTYVWCQHIVYIEVKRMNNCMRAKDIIARFIDSRPAGESCEQFSRRVGLRNTLTVEEINGRKDLYTGLVYQIARVFGYQIIFYNPNPPEGLSKTYVVGEKRSQIRPREETKKVRYTVDTYDGKVYRFVRKYKKKKPKIKVVNNAEKRNQGK